MRPVVQVGAVMALALLGDALLYLALPAYASRLALPLWTVGILLGANRFVRLLTNSGAAVAFARFGRWPVMVAASVTAVLTTATYGLTVLFLLLLIARLMWGACYSILRLGGLLTVLETSLAAYRGRQVGVFHSISRIGPMVGVVLGGIALDRLGFSTTFLIVAAVSAIGIPFAVTLPRPPHTPGGARPVMAGRAHIFGSRPLVLVKSVALMNGLVFHGMVFPTVVLALAAAASTGGATTLGGVLVSLRSGTDLLLAAPLGHLSDRLGRARVLPLFLLLEAGALGALAMGLSLGVAAVIVTLIALFILSTAVGTAADAAAGDLAGARRAEVMSSYADWLDLGAAVGPVVGLSIVGAFGLRPAYVLGTVLLALTGVVFAALSNHSAALTVDESLAD